MHLEVGRMSAEGLFRPTALPPSRSKLRARLHLALILIDLLCLVGGFLLADRLYDRANPHNWLLIGWGIIPIYFGAAFNCHAYSARLIQLPWLGVTRAAKAFLIAIAVVMIVAFALKTTAAFSRVTIVLGCVLSVSMLMAARGLFLRRANRILGGNPYSVVLISDGTLSMPLDGFSMIVAAGDVNTAAANSPATHNRLASVLQDSDRVVVACTPALRERWVGLLKGAGIRSEIVAPELGHLQPLALDHWGGAPTLVVADGPLSRFDEALKRAFDIVLAGAGLIVLAPLLVATAILVKLDSAGPVFFVQPRLGRGNRMFHMLKFRSMRAERCDSAGAQSTGRTDDRITRVGAFIRKTSIDELPQLINVLFGDMSIVGPRPHALGSRAEDKLFWEIDERYWHRHALKPGLTGLAQVRGFRGATLFERDLTDRLQADLEYVTDWSIWKDVKIMFMTFSVLMHKNAF